MYVKSFPLDDFNITLVG